MLYRRFNVFICTISGLEIMEILNSDIHNNLPLEPNRISDERI